jgi:hypothetical protein
MIESQGQHLVGFQLVDLVHSIGASGKVILKSLAPLLPPSVGPLDSFVPTWSRATSRSF